MNLDDWLNSKPDLICFHDMSLVCFEMSSDYLFFRWGLFKDESDSYDELKELDKSISEDELLLFDQVFYKPDITDILLSSGACVIDMIVDRNQFHDDEMEIFAYDMYEKYLHIKFKFEKFKMRLLKKVSFDEFYDKDNKEDINKAFKDFSFEDFEQGKGYMNVDNIAVGQKET